MDQQRPFLYLTLFFLGFLIWTTWNAPKPTEKQVDGTTQTQVTPNSNEPTSTVPSVASSSAPGNIIPADKNTNIQKLVHIKTDVLDLYINTQGATIVQADLPTYPVSLDKKDVPVRILDQKVKGYTAQSGLRHQDINGKYQSDLGPNHYAIFNSEKNEYILKDGQTSLTVPFTWTNQKGISVVKTFTFKRGDFSVEQKQTINNQTQKPWVGSEYLQLTHNKHQTKTSLLGGVIAYVGFAYYHDKYIKVKFSDIEEETLNDQAKGGWAAALEHYFISAWIPNQEVVNTYYTIHDGNKNNYILGVKSPEITINSGATGAFTSKFYVGPTDQDKLAAIAKGLDLTVDYGIFAFVSKPIFAVMKFIHEYVGNWGWTIILLTLLIKIIFFYPSAMSYKSMAKMKKLAPKIKEISNTYKNDPQGKQKATMDFYRKEKINPLGGCLPMLIQMPVFMGLYWVLQESVELRQAPWILWYKDLSIRDPYFVLPLIYGATMFIQQKLNPPVAQDPATQKMFTYMPIIFTFLFLFFPAGLVLYWVVNQVLSIAQQWYINKKIIGET